MNNFTSGMITHIQNLSPETLWFLMIFAILLFLFLAYRILGLGGALGIMVIIFFVYVFYSNDTFAKYREKQSNEELRALELDQELQKDATRD